LVVGQRDFPMLEADARSFVEKAAALKSPADLFIANDRDHMGVVKSLVEEKSPVLERIVDFLTSAAK
jgi:hypothetical protein